MKTRFHLPFGEGLLRISCILKEEGDDWPQFWVLCSVSFYCEFLRLVVVSPFVMVQPPARNNGQGLHGYQQCSLKERGKEATI